MGFFDFLKSPDIDAGVLEYHGTPISAGGYLNHYLDTRDIRKWTAPIVHFLMSLV